MIAGLTGSLLSHEAVSHTFELIHRDCPTPDYRWFHAWQQQIAQEMGPTSTARHVFDRVAVPLVARLGLRAVPAATPAALSSIHAVLHTDRSAVATLLATDWGRDVASAWNEAVRLGIVHNLRWCICITGTALRIIDATHTYTRRFSQFDLPLVSRDPAALSLLVALLHADGFGPEETSIDRAVALSERHRTAVRTALQEGVHDALILLLRAFATARPRRRQVPADALFEESLVVIYRILFLLFAEARGLVPKWHPVYRDSYTIESLRGPAEQLPRPPGLWQSIQAIARLAHRGCRAGTLHVPPFNGRLFSPIHAPLAESLMLDDGVVREALLALTTHQHGPVRRRIAYADLGVEQLGGVYERILDYAPSKSPRTGGTLTLTRVGRRKTTGTFYTPRALTEFLVRRALAPLVAGASPEQILSLRILDPAMGSGAFLVAVCRCLAAAYESALIRDGVYAGSDITDAERANFRRLIVQRCLFGVDINPMAVQLARLSLWLATLARDKPLTFLDHHLRVGNSLAGVFIEDLLRPPRARRARSASPDLPLFDFDAVEQEMRPIIASRLRLALQPDDTVDHVQSKEQLLTSLQRPDGPLATWQRVANLWCAEWFTHAGERRASTAFGPLADEILGRGGVIPAHVSKPLLDNAQAVAARERLFHWQLEFPEVFLDAEGGGDRNAGFDAVVGNPPWEVLRGDRGTADDTALTEFSRRSGVYSWQGAGHANLYQLFLERVLRLTRHGGRVAVVVPSGFAIDHGCAPLRAALMDLTSIDTFVTLENRDALFPIHRGLKFLLVTATRGGRTTTIPCRSGVRSVFELERMPDAGDVQAVGLARSIVEKFSGDQLAIPEIRDRLDASILSQIAFQFAPLSSSDGWGVSFGRELNATDDREHFHSRPGRGSLPVLEGKQIEPFVAHVNQATNYVPEPTAARLLGAHTFSTPRLAYRDVASASNRLTVIAAIVPGAVVTTHTLFCLKGSVARHVHLFLCAILNSFVANYLVRMRVGTHVTVSIMERLPVPRPAVDSLQFRRIAKLADRVIRTRSLRAVADIHASVAHLYHLSSDQFQHVLDTFPLVPSDERTSAMQAYLRQRTDVTVASAGLESHAS
jgi:Eco57I restriction-modification methylase